MHLSRLGQITAILYCYPCKTIKTLQSNQNAEACVLTGTKIKDIIYSSQFQLHCTGSPYKKKKKNPGQNLKSFSLPTKLFMATHHYILKSPQCTNTPLKHCAPRMQDQADTLSTIKSRIKMLLSIELIVRATSGSPSHYTLSSSPINTCY